LASLISINKSKKYFKYFILIFVVLFCIFLSLNFLYPLDSKRLFKPQSTIVYDRNNVLLRLGLSEDGFLRIPLPKAKIEEDIKQTLIAYEDKYFYYHFGINPFSVLRALWFNLQNRRVIGASTLTMQLARMMHHKPRTIKNKFIEMFMALQLEFYYSKEEILRMYLDNAPYGGNIEGFASASFAYFALPVQSLSLAQIAYLVSIPKNPNRNASKNLALVQTLKKRVLKNLLENGYLKKERYKRAIREKLKPKRHHLPFFAPHLSQKFNKGQKIKTTIDFALQERISKYLKENIIKFKKFKKFKIYNASAIVIENKSMEILAYIGSQDFDDKKHFGQIDGLNALFSPASTLKPFVYAKALERGFITPLKKLYDLPLFIAGYTPLNYTKHFYGEITAKEALEFSLNIPAVELDRLLGQDSLYSVLKKAKISSISHPKSYYGSSLTLGGCGITLRNLAELFASFANKGIYKKSTYLFDDNTSQGIALISEEASYLISQILLDAPREKFSSSWEYIKDMPLVAFKTGTSAHAKDLLSIGYNNKYTVAVWYGNFDGKAPLVLENKKARTGRNTASPTLHSIFAMLKKPKERFFKKPKNIIKKKICQDAIQIGECKNSIEDDVIKGVKEQMPCEVLRAEILAKILEDKAISFENLKLHRCYERWKNYNPLIANPIDKERYIQNKLLPKAFKKTPLQCYAFENNATIYWLIDNKEAFKSISAKKTYYYLGEGKHIIRCLDQGAKMSRIEVEMEEL